jgi:hypothetical protein
LLDRQVGWHTAIIRLIDVTSIDVTSLAFYRSLS